MRCSSEPPQRSNRWIPFNTKTHQLKWVERVPGDSANKPIVIPDGDMDVDGPDTQDSGGQAQINAPEVSNSESRAIVSKKRKRVDRCEVRDSPDNIEGNSPDANESGSTPIDVSPNHMEVDDPEVYDSADGIEDDGPEENDSESSEDDGPEEDDSESSEEQDLAAIPVAGPISLPATERDCYFLVESILIFKYGKELERSKEGMEPNPNQYKRDRFYWSSKVKSLARARQDRVEELGLPLNNPPKRTSYLLRRQWEYLQKLHENGLLLLDDNGMLIDFSRRRALRSSELNTPLRRSLGLSWTAAEETVYERFLGDPRNIDEKFLKPLAEGKGGEMPAATSRREINWDAFTKYFPARTEAMLKARYAKATKAPEARGYPGWIPWSKEELIKMAELFDRRTPWTRIVEHPVLAANRRTAQNARMAYKRHIGDLDPKQREDKLRVLKYELRLRKACTGEVPDED